MTHATPAGMSDDDRESWEDREEASFWAAREADGPTASAEQFHISDMQHWIDLSA
jgi:hypothetical protein